MKYTLLAEEADPAHGPFSGSLTTLPHVCVLISHAIRFLGISPGFRRFHGSAGGFPAMPRPEGEGAQEGQHTGPVAERERVSGPRFSRLPRRESA